VGGGVGGAAGVLDGVGARGVGEGIEFGGAEVRAGDFAGPDGNPADTGVCVQPASEQLTRTAVVASAPFSRLSLFLGGAMTAAYVACATAVRTHRRQGGVEPHSRVQEGGVAMRVKIGIIIAGVIVGSVAAVMPAASASPRAGALHVTKDCREYSGKPGGYCTIRSSNIKATKVGSKVVYTSPPSAEGTLDSDLVVDNGDGSRLFGHVTLNATTMAITLAGGTGQFRHFTGSADVTVTDAGDPELALWHWDGQYSFGNEGHDSSDD
jgi:hypothetical protein